MSDATVTNSQTTPGLETQRPVRVFISYRRDDNEYNHILNIVRATLDELNKNKELKDKYPGISIEKFIDVNSIDYGQRWQEKVEKALDESELLLAFITGGYLTSSQCRFELTTFMNKYGDKLCIPVFWNSRKKIEQKLQTANEEHAEEANVRDSSAKEARELVDEINGIEGILPDLVAILKNAQDDYGFVEKCIVDWLQSKMLPVIEKMQDTSDEDEVDDRESGNDLVEHEAQGKKLSDFIGKTLYMEARGGYATGSIIDKDGKFVIKKGSKIAPGYTNTCPQTVKDRRNEFAESLKDGILTEDIPFNSLSGAAGFISGRSINGKAAWKTEDGLSIKELIES